MHMHMRGSAEGLKESTEITIRHVSFMMCTHDLRT